MSLYLSSQFSKYLSLSELILSCLIYYNFILKMHNCYSRPSTRHFGYFWILHFQIKYKISLSYPIKILELGSTLILEKVMALLSWIFLSIIIIFLSNYFDFQAYCSLVFYDYFSIMICFPRYIPGQFLKDFSDIMDICLLILPFLLLLLLTLFHWPLFINLAFSETMNSSNDSNN